MSSPRIRSAAEAARFVPVDASRLLLILARFARPVDKEVLESSFLPTRDVVAHFTPEYYLHKLDFLLRYPGYFAYELSELHRMGLSATGNRAEMMGVIRALLGDKEPEVMTLPFRKFWRGAYERLDNVESWWYSRGLVYRTLESRKGAPPQKHYFLTEAAICEAERLALEVEHAKWYRDRIEIIHRFFGHFSAAEVKHLQYKHAAYREAQLNEWIPNISIDEIETIFAEAFGEPLGVSLEQ